MSTYSLFLVILQFTFMGFLVWTKAIFNWDLASIFVQSLGLLIAVWGVLVIKIGNFNIQPEVKSVTLITQGPYKILRNPMYTGILLIFAPSVAYSNQLSTWIVFGLLICTLLLKIFKEESFLLTKFGNEYHEYRSKTWRLLPLLF